jgi:Asp-tRNA(Asn)/Glu-tRNA(Gln) amidotransferase A subunit family amidase
MPTMAGRATVSGFADYERHDALGLAELVRRRQVSPSDLLEAAIARVEGRNPKIDAVTSRTTLVRPEARARLLRRLSYELEYRTTRGDAAGVNR